MQVKLFEHTLELLERYKNISNPTNEFRHVVAEIITRLQDVAKEYEKANQLNGYLLNEDVGLKHQREIMTDEFINKIMSKQAKKDSELAECLKSAGGKLKRGSSTEISVFNMTKLTQKNTKDIKQLHYITESIYNNLWLIKQRLNQLPKFKNFNPPGVRNVRNQLMTHTERTNSESYIFSFGVSTQGPVLRPIKPSGVKAPTDKGLYTNVEEFFSSIINILE
ncbi:hypothetical protein A2Z67_02080 [Candidatus Woesebacteria bacterium RBG_13_36_22]|uniref:Uncharacterized protein n=1 Tax=Candidatus Woesebacteria bacterium RBG_13_36_22 TaxID=1802478 RepID=A0A1F7X092_9BACT|nr:MAG: hypothetical protein A2Z67_02080 [Candidatus Woesebacteria bacterium RBG_13_36_22]